MELLSQKIHFYLPHKISRLTVPERYVALVLWEYFVCI